jgi:rubrerythrin
MTDPTTSVSLSDSELLLLDGACTAKVQTEVDLARARVDYAAAHPEVSAAAVKVIVAAVAEARTNGLLSYDHQALNRCPVCEATGGYVAYKSGPRKGQPNHSKPTRLRGIELRRSFVRFEGHVSIGACTTCMAEIAPLIAAELASVPAELPAQLRTEGAPAWVKDQHRRCKHCDWTGGESKLGLLPAVLGGQYPGKCPSCGDEQRALGERFIETLDTFEMIPAPEAAA